MFVGAFLLGQTMRYDGSIKIDSGIETKSLEKDKEKLLKILEQLAEAQKSFLEAGGSKGSSVYKEYARDIQKVEDELKSLEHAESIAESDEHWNQLKIDVEEYAKSLKELETQGKYFGDEDYDRVYLAWKNAKDAIKEYRSELNKKTVEGQAKEAERQAAAQRKAEEQAEKALQKENARIQKEIENEARLQAKEAERQAKIEAEAAEEERLAQIRKNAVVNNQHIVDVLERRKQLLEEIADLEKAGVTKGYADYDIRQQELSLINKEIKDYNNNIGKTKESYKKLSDTAKKSFDKVNCAQKKAIGLLGSFGTKLKSIISAIFIFNLIRKALTSLINGVKEGFTNLYNENDRFKKSVDSLKTSASTLKNSLAAAFAPLVEIAIPYIQRFIDMLTRAVDLIGQFIAAISGQKAYTKAVKQTTAAVKDNTKANNKQLSSLDKLNNLTSGSDSNDSGAGAMFEEVPVDSRVLDFVEKLKALLKPVLDYAKKLKKVFAQGFWKGLGDWEYRWESIKDSAKSIKESLIDIFTDRNVIVAADRWAQSVAYMLGSYAGSVASTGLTIAANLIGGMAKYLDQNKERIKKYLISMFDIWSDINDLFADLFQSIAFVFEAFASEQGQQLTANIIGIFADAFMGITELASKLLRDIANLIIQPFVDNKEAFRQALEGFLGVLSEVTGTIKQGIDETFAKFSEIYDEHLKPFFDSVAQGLSELTAEFLEFWNGSVQPVLDEWAAKFDVLWKEHLQPCLNKIGDALGQVADAAKELWQNVLQPAVNWIIQNVLPVLLPILNDLYDVAITVSGGIIDSIGSLVSTVADCISFIVKLIQGDWRGAWDSALSSVQNAVSAILSWIESLISSISRLGSSGWFTSNLLGNAFSQLKSNSGMAVATPSGVSTDNLNSTVAALSNVDFPAYATGQVIPRTMKQHLAILGDNSRDTEVVSPLSTMKQAVKEAIAEIGGGNGDGKITINNIVTLDGRVVFESTQDYAIDYFNRTGKAPYPI